MEGEYLPVTSLSMLCACSGQLEYKFDSKKGMYIQCKKCSREYPIDEKQRPKYNALKDAYESIIGEHKMEIEQLKRDKENLKHQYGKEEIKEPKQKVQEKLDLNKEQIEFIQDTINEYGYF